MKLSNVWYDRLKFLALVALPALAVAYAGLAELWGWGHTSQVSGSIVVLDTLLGALLQISTSKYNQDDDNYAGTLGVNGQDPDTGLPNLQLMITQHPDEILTQDRVRLKVTPGPVVR